MKITESKLRKMIRSELKKLRESSTGSTGLGAAKKKGYQSASGKSAQTDFDAKKATYDARQATYDTAAADLAAFDMNTKFRKARTGRGQTGYDYFATPGSKGSGRSTNPDWMNKDTAKTAAGRNRDSAATDKTSAKSTLDTQTAADLEKTRPKQKPPSGGGAGFGKGKTAGKAGKKGKKKKN